MLVCNQKNSRLFYYDKIISAFGGALHCNAAKRASGLASEMEPVGIYVTGTDRQNLGAV